MRSLYPSLLAAAVLAACSPAHPVAEAPRPVRTVQVEYAAPKALDTYSGTVRARYEIEQAFRVGGKVVRRAVEVGQTVRAGDVIAVLDDADLRLAVEAAQQQLRAAQSQATQAQADHRRLIPLRDNGFISPTVEERARSGAESSGAQAEAGQRQLALSRNRLDYAVLRAAQSGVVTAVRFEAGQVVAEGQPIVSIARTDEREVVIDVPENKLAALKGARLSATTFADPDRRFDLELRELAPAAASVTRTFRARLRPTAPQPDLVLGMTVNVRVQSGAAAAPPVAALPSTALTQLHGQPAVWIVAAAAAEPVGAVELAPVEVHGYRNEEVLVSGLPAGRLVVVAGVQKLAPGLKVAIAPAVARSGSALAQAGAAR